MCHSVQTVRMKTDYSSQGEPPLDPELPWGMVRDPRDGTIYTVQWFEYKPTGLCVVHM